MTAFAPRRPVRSAAQGGSTLLEVLIAMLVLSFGLLGLAGLTAASLRYVKMAQFQSIGVQLAAELGERMRGNVDGFEAGSYIKTDAYSTAAVTIPACASSPCSAADLAAIDLAQWAQELRRRLPGGDGFVQRDAVNPLATDIWILWSDPDATVGAADDAKASLSVAGANDCPAVAVAGLAAGTVKPRCMYYRITL
ncbi:type IV pilus modification protein PilV [Variovorax sp. SRS16]|uniref:type IV pilus modification protein PilV n=1 Tax=Variovorax sp. SRS16 TaxID=282217 RepID=UPI001318B7D7|nr:type IV pilus modification protein PilV [Variovorax sp. SRS16]VTU18498.1 type IV pilus modification protein PilV [Variovorax sp. SRS16]